MLGLQVTLAISLLTLVLTGGMAFAVSLLDTDSTSSDCKSDCQDNTDTSNSGLESDSDTENNSFSSDSGLEQMTIKAQLKNAGDFGLADYGIKKFRFAVSDGSEICPTNNCEYRVENGEVSDYLGSGYVFEGKLKVTIPEDDSRSSKLYNFRFELDKTGEEESEGQTVQLLEGRYGIGSQLTYDIPNATLIEGKNPVLTLHGERTQSANFTNQNTNVEVLE